MDGEKYVIEQLQFLPGIWVDIYIFENRPKRLIMRSLNIIMIDMDVTEPEQFRQALKKLRVVMDVYLVGERLHYFRGE